MGNVVDPSADAATTPLHKVDQFALELHSTFVFETLVEFRVSLVASVPASQSIAARPATIAGKGLRLSAAAFQVGGSFDNKATWLAPGEQRSGVVRAAVDVVPPEAMELAAAGEWGSRAASSMQTAESIQSPPEATTTRVVLSTMKVRLVGLAPSSFYTIRLDADVIDTTGTATSLPAAYAPLPPKGPLRNKKQQQQPIAADDVTVLATLPPILLPCATWHLASSVGCMGRTDRHLRICITRLDNPMSEALFDTSVAAARQTSGAGGSAAASAMVVRGVWLPELASGRPAPDAPAACLQHAVRAKPVLGFAQAIPGTAARHRRTCLLPALERIAAFDDLISETMYQIEARSILCMDPQPTRMELADALNISATISVTPSTAAAGLVKNTLHGLYGPAHFIHTLPKAKASVVAITPSQVSIAVERPDASEFLRAALLKLPAEQRARYLPIGGADEALLVVARVQQLRKARRPKSPGASSTGGGAGGSGPDGKKPLVLDAFDGSPSLPNSAQANGDDTIDLSESAGSSDSSGDDAASATDGGAEDADGTTSRPEMLDDDNDDDALSESKLSFKSGEKKAALLFTPRHQDHPGWEVRPDGRESFTTDLLIVGIVSPDAPFVLDGLQPRSLYSIKYFTLAPADEAEFRSVSMHQDYRFAVDADRFIGLSNFMTNKVPPIASAGESIEATSLKRGAQPSKDAKKAGLFGTTTSTTHNSNSLANTATGAVGFAGTQQRAVDDGFVQNDYVDQYGKLLSLNPVVTRDKRAKTKRTGEEATKLAEDSSLLQSGACADSAAFVLASQHLLAALIVNGKRLGSQDEPIELPAHVAADSEGARQIFLSSNATEAVHVRDVSEKGAELVMASDLADAAKRAFLADDPLFAPGNAYGVPPLLALAFKKGVFEQLKELRATRKTIFCARVLEVPRGEIGFRQQRAFVNLRRCPIRALSAREVAYLLQRSGHSITEEFYAEYVPLGDCPLSNVPLDKLPSEDSLTPAPSGRNTPFGGSSRASTPFFPVTGQDGNKAFASFMDHPQTPLDMPMSEGDGPPAEEAEEGKVARVIQIFFASCHGRLRMTSLEGDQRYIVSACGARYIPQPTTELFKDEAAFDAPATLHWSPFAAPESFLTDFVPKTVSIVNYMSEGLRFSVSERLASVEMHKAMRLREQGMARVVTDAFLTLLRKQHERQRSQYTCAVDLTYCDEPQLNKTIQVRHKRSSEEGVFEFHVNLPEDARYQLRVRMGVPKLEDLAGEGRVGEMAQLRAVRVGGQPTGDHPDGTSDPSVPNTTLTTGAAAPDVKSGFLTPGSAMNLSMSPCQPPATQPLQRPRARKTTDAESVTEFGSFSPLVHFLVACSDVVESEEYDRGIRCFCHSAVSGLSRAQSTRKARYHSIGNKEEFARKSFDEHRQRSFSLFAPGVIAIEQSLLTPEESSKVLLGDALDETQTGDEVALKVLQMCGHVAVSCPAKSLFFINPLVQSELDAHVVHVRNLEPGMYTVVVRFLLVLNKICPAWERPAHQRRRSSVNVTAAALASAALTPSGEAPPMSDPMSSSRRGSLLAPTTSLQRLAKPIPGRRQSTRTPSVYVRDGPGPGDGMAAIAAAATAAAAAKAAAALAQPAETDKAPDATEESATTIAAEPPPTPSGDAAPADPFAAFTTTSFNPAPVPQVVKPPTDDPFGGFAAKASDLKQREPLRSPGAPLRVARGRSVSLIGGTGTTGQSLTANLHAALRRAGKHDIGTCTLYRRHEALPVMVGENSISIAAVCVAAALFNVPIYKMSEGSDASFDAEGLTDVQRQKDILADFTRKATDVYREENGMAMPGLAVNSLNVPGSIFGATAGHLLFGTRPTLQQMTGSTFDSGVSADVVREYSKKEPPPLEDILQGMHNCPVNLAAEPVFSGYRAGPRYPLLPADCHIGYLSVEQDRLMMVLKQGFDAYCANQDRLKAELAQSMANALPLVNLEATLSSSRRRSSISLGASGSLLMAPAPPPPPVAAAAVHTKPIDAPEVAAEASFHLVRKEICTIEVEITQAEERNTKSARVFSYSPDTAQQVTVSGLDPGTEYRIRLRVQGRFSTFTGALPNWSHWSLPIRFTTLGKWQTECLYATESSASVMWKRLKSLPLSFMQLQHEHSEGASVFAKASGVMSGPSASSSMFGAAQSMGFTTEQSFLRSESTRFAGVFDSGVASIADAASFSLPAALHGVKMDDEYLSRRGIWQLPVCVKPGIIDLRPPGAATHPDLASGGGSSDGGPPPGFHGGRRGSLGKGGGKSSNPHQDAVSKRKRQYLHHVHSHFTPLEVEVSLYDTVTKDAPAVDAKHPKPGSHHHHHRHHHHHGQQRSMVIYQTCRIVLPGGADGLRLSDLYPGMKYVLRVRSVSEARASDIVECEVDDDAHVDHSPFLNSSGGAVADDGEMGSMRILAGAVRSGKHKMFTVKPWVFGHWTPRLAIHTLSDIAVTVLTLGVDYCVLRAEKVAADLSDLDASRRKTIADDRLNQPTDPGAEAKAAFDSSDSSSSSSSSSDSESDGTTSPGDGTTSPGDGTAKRPPSVSSTPPFAATPECENLGSPPGLVAEESMRIEASRSMVVLAKFDGKSPKAPKLKKKRFSDDQGKLGVPRASQPSRATRTGPHATIVDPFEPPNPPNPTDGDAKAQRKANKSKARGGGVSTSPPNHGKFMYQIRLRRAAEWAMPGAPAPFVLFGSNDASTSGPSEAGGSKKPRSAAKPTVEKDDDGWSLSSSSNSGMSPLLTGPGGGDQDPLHTVRIPSFFAADSAEYDILQTTEISQASTATGRKKNKGNTPGEFRMDSLQPNTMYLLSIRPVVVGIDANGQWLDMLRFVTPDPTKLKITELCEDQMLAEWTPPAMQPVQLVSVDNRRVRKAYEKARSASSAQAAFSGAASQRKSTSVLGDSKRLRAAATAAAAAAGHPPLVFAIVAVELEIEGKFLDPLKRLPGMSLAEITATTPVVKKLQRFDITTTAPPIATATVSPPTSSFQPFRHASVAAAPAAAAVATPAAAALQVLIEHLVPDTCYTMRLRIHDSNGCMSRFLHCSAAVTHPAPAVRPISVGETFAVVQLHRAPRCLQSLKLLRNWRQAMLLKKVRLDALRARILRLQTRIAVIDKFGVDQLAASRAARVADEDDEGDDTDYNSDNSENEEEEEDSESGSSEDRKHRKSAASDDDAPLDTEFEGMTSEQLRSEEALARFLFDSSATLTAPLPPVLCTNDDACAKLLRVAVPPVKYSAETQQQLLQRAAAAASGNGPPVTWLTTANVTEEEALQSVLFDDPRLFDFSKTAVDVSFHPTGSPAASLFDARGELSGAFDCGIDDDAASSISASPAPPRHAARTLVTRENLFPGAVLQRLLPLQTDGGTATPPTPTFAASQSGTKPVPRSMESSVQAKPLEPEASVGGGSEAAASVSRATSTCTSDEHHRSGPAACHVYPELEPHDTQPVPWASDVKVTRETSDIVVFRGLPLDRPFAIGVRVVPPLLSAKAQLFSSPADNDDRGHTTAEGSALPGGGGIGAGMLGPTRSYRRAGLPATVDAMDLSLSAPKAEPTFRPESVLEMIQRLPLFRCRSDAALLSFIFGPLLKDVAGFAAGMWSCGLSLRTSPPTTFKTELITEHEALFAVSRPRRGFTLVEPSPSASLHTTSSSQMQQQQPPAKPTPSACGPQGYTCSKYQIAVNGRPVSLRSTVLVVDEGQTKLVHMHGLPVDSDVTIHVRTLFLLHDAIAAIELDQKNREKQAEQHRQQQQYAPVAAPGGTKLAAVLPAAVPSPPSPAITFATDTLAARKSIVIWSHFQLVVTGLRTAPLRPSLPVLYESRTVSHRNFAYNTDQHRATVQAAYAPHIAFWWSRDTDAKRLFPKILFSGERGGTQHSSRKSVLSKTTAVTALTGLPATAIAQQAKLIAVCYDEKVSVRDVTMQNMAAIAAGFAQTDILSVACQPRWDDQPSDRNGGGGGAMTLFDAAMALSDTAVAKARAYLPEELLTQSERDPTKPLYTPCDPCYSYDVEVAEYWPLAACHSAFVHIASVSGGFFRGQLPRDQTDKHAFVPPERLVFRIRTTVKTPATAAGIIASTWSPTIGWRAPEAPPPVNNFQCVQDKHGVVVASADYPTRPFHNQLIFELLVRSSIEGHTHASRQSVETEKVFMFVDCARMTPPVPLGEGLYHHVALRAVSTFGTSLPSAWVTLAPQALVVPHVQDVRRAMPTFASTHHLAEAPPPPGTTANGSGNGGCHAASCASLHPYVAQPSTGAPARTGKPHRALTVVPAPNGTRGGGRQEEPPAPWWADGDDAGLDTQQQQQRPPSPGGGGGAVAIPSAAELLPYQQPVPINAWSLPFPRQRALDAFPCPLDSNFHFASTVDERQRRRQSHEQCVTIHTLPAFVAVVRVADRPAVAATSPSPTGEDAEARQRVAASAGCPVLAPKTTPAPKVQNVRSAMQKIHKLNPDEDEDSRALRAGEPPAAVSDGEVGRNDDHEEDFDAYAIEDDDGSSMDDATRWFDAMAPRRPSEAAGPSGSGTARPLMIQPSKPPMALTTASSRKQSGGPPGSPVGGVVVAVPRRKGDEYATVEELLATFSYKKAPAALFTGPPSPPPLPKPRAAGFTEELRRLQQQQQRDEVSPRKRRPATSPPRAMPGSGTMAMTAADAIFLALTSTASPARGSAFSSASQRQQASGARRPSSGSPRALTGSTPPPPSRPVGRQGVVVVEKDVVRMTKLAIAPFVALHVTQPVVMTLQPPRGASAQGRGKK